MTHTSPPSIAPHPDIVPREQLSFGFDQDIPKYWFGGDPFKTRLFDAMSLIFPPGERFFMTCVRDFRDQITDFSIEEDFLRFDARALGLGNFMGGLDPSRFHSSTTNAAATTSPPTASR